MIIKQVGTIKEPPKGEWDMRDWVIDDLTDSSDEYPMSTEVIVQEMIEIARQYGIYLGCFRV